MMDGQFSTGVLLVCMGNICRSPTAEGVLRAQIERAGLGGRFNLDSAGTHGYHVGEAPDGRAQQAAAKRGYDISRLRARRVVAEDFRRFDFVLAMDRSNLASLELMCPKSYSAKLRLLMDYAPDQGCDEVPDPYYGGPAGFERVLDMCEAAALGFIAACAEAGEGG